MLSVGAYSTKFQNLEKERLRQLKEREKSNRGKAHLYSKQTAQRQRALEEKKRAMVVAEEDRRKKALEERREAQKQATKRFKSALGRIRSSSKSQGQMITKDSSALDFYLPDKPRPKKVSSQPQLKPSISSEVQEERVALGKEVEIKIKPKNGYHHPPRQVNGLQQRTPSLDDVLRQIKGENNQNSNSESPTNHGRIHVHQSQADTSKQQQQQQHVHYSPMGGRSASDPSLNVNHQNFVPVKPSNSHRLSSHATSNLHRNSSDENIVFRHIDNVTAHGRVPIIPKMEDDLRVTSPETPDNSSSVSLSENSLNGSEPNDSLNNAVTFTVGEEQTILTAKTTNQQTGSGSNSDLTGNVVDGEITYSELQSHSSHASTNSHSVSKTADTSSVPQGANIPTPADQHPIYVCDDDEVSSVDSLEDCEPKSTPVRTKRHRKHHNGIPSTSNVDNQIVTSTPISTHRPEEVQECGRQNHSPPPKNETNDPENEKKSKKNVVGILKKSASNSRVPSTSSTANSSISNSTVTINSQKNIGSDLRPREDSAKSQKKVRFVDQVETSNIETNVKKSTNSENEFIDSARLDLWKRVLPNGVTTHYLPNSAFTPKMRVSLLSKASISQGISGPPTKPMTPSNGITVHIPIAAADNSPGPSPTRKQSEAKIDPSKEQLSSTNDRGSDMNPPRCDTPQTMNGKTASSDRDNYSMALAAEEELSQLDTMIANAGEMDPSSLATKQISLEKTPTDDDINHLWDQIRHALQDNQKVTVPPQVFNFRIRPDIPENGSVTSQTSTLSKKEDQRGHSPLPGSVRRNTSTERMNSRPGDVPPQRGTHHRQTNLSRPMRCQKNVSHQQPQLLGRRGHSHTATYPVSNRQDHTVLANRTQPVSLQKSSAEPSDLVVKATGSNAGRRAPTALSLEEQRLMLSIETLNQQIKDHMAMPPGMSKFESPVSPEPPDFTPEYYPHPPPSPTPPQRHRGISTHPHNYPQAYGRVNGRSRGYSDLPKTRVRRNPKTVAMAAAINAQVADHSRTHSRVPAYRQPFYNS